VQAEQRLSRRKGGYTKGDIDAEAAAIILQDYLEEKYGA
jgi:RNase H-fold protein (predicted Holliday junction resolvase)